jgi:hypothetical protein
LWSGNCRCLETLKSSRRVFLADGVGFEPTVRLHVRRFSRPLPSTTRPPILRARHEMPKAKPQLSPCAVACRGIARLPYLRQSVTKALRPTPPGINRRRYRPSHSGRQALPSPTASASRLALRTNRITALPGPPMSLRRPALLIACSFLATTVTAAGVDPRYGSEPPRHLSARQRPVPTRLRSPPVPENFAPLARPRYQTTAPPEFLRG